MNEKFAELLNITSKFSKIDAIQDTLIPNFKIIQTSKANDKIYDTYKPSFCFILQGSKNVILNDEIYNYSPGQYLMTSIELPVTGQVIKATNQKPYYCLMIEFDPSMVFEVLKSTPIPSPKSIPVSRGVFVGSIDDAITDALLRLIRCLNNPADIPVLSPMIIKEIIYRLLCGENGDSIRQMGIVGSQTHNISRVIEIIKKDFAHSMNVESLAKIAGMSSSTFHKYFKEITAMSPIQFQKLVRLQEARRLLLIDAGDAATISYQVGYESPSQFSREYSRLFGHPPKADMKRLKVS